MKIGSDLHSRGSKAMENRIQEGLDIPGEYFGQKRKIKVSANKSNYWYTWAKCPKCDKGKWVNMYMVTNGVLSKTRCKDCLAKYDPTRYKPGDKVKTGVGFRYYLPTDDEFYSRTNKSMAEHRYIMSKHVGYLLKTTEHVHHKNGNVYDNRIENLELWCTYHPYGQRVEDVIIHYLDTMSEEEAYRVIQQSKHFKFHLARILLH